LVETEYDWQKVGRKLISIYDKLVEQQTDEESCPINLKPVCTDGHQTGAPA